VNLPIIVLLLAAASAQAQQSDIPKTIAESVGRTFRYTQGQILGAAEAMPAEKYSFIPTVGEFRGARSFGEQVKHAACANFAFFNQVEGKTPPQECEKGGPSKAATKPELLKYLRDSFDYANRVLATIDSSNALARVDGRYGGPNTQLGMAVTAVWHIADHYGQLVEYLRMTGIVPPATRQYPLNVR
jgi:hypothetical protein